MEDTVPGISSKTDNSAARETTLIRERNSAASATAMLTEQGRAERDRLLIAAAICVLVCLPGKFEKLAIGPVEFSELSAGALRIGALVSVIYFAITFATQALMDLLRWKATFRMGLVELMPRIDIHSEALNQRSLAAQEHYSRFMARIEAHLAEIDPMTTELLAIIGSSRPDRAREDELECKIAAAHDRLRAENELDDHSYAESNDYKVVLGIEKRVIQLRALMWANVIAMITMPLFIAALAMGPAIWLLISDAR